MDLVYLILSEVTQSHGLRIIILSEVTQSQNKNLHILFYRHSLIAMAIYVSK